MYAFRPVYLSKIMLGFLLAMALHAETEADSENKAALQSGWKFLGPDKQDVTKIALLDVHDTYDPVLLCDGSDLSVFRDDHWECLRDRVCNFETGGKNNSSIFVYAGGDLFLASDDYGQSWRKLHLPGDGINPADMCYSQSRLGILGRQRRLWVSTNEGNSWQKHNMDMNAEFCTNSLHIDPMDADRMYVGVRPSGLYNVVFPNKKVDGKTEIPLRVVRTDNGGESWHSLPSEKDDPFSGKKPFANLVAGSTAENRILYATTLFGTRQARAAVLRSKDGGKTWYTFENQKRLGTITAISVAPDYPEKVCIASRDGVLYQSQNGGKTWRKIFSIAHGKVNDLIYRPAGRDTIYVATSRGVYHKQSLGIENFVTRKRVYSFTLAMAALSCLACIGFIIKDFLRHTSIFLRHRVALLMLILGILLHSPAIAYPVWYEVNAAGQALLILWFTGAFVLALVPTVELFHCKNWTVRIISAVSALYLAAALVFGVLEYMI